MTEADQDSVWTGGEYRQEVNRSNRNGSQGQVASVRSHFR